MMAITQRPERRNSRLYGHTPTQDAGNLEEGELALDAAVQPHMTKTTGVSLALRLAPSYARELHCHLAQKARHR